MTEYTTKIRSPKQSPTTSLETQNWLSKRKSDEIMAGDVEIDNSARWSTGQSTDTKVVGMARSTQEDDAAMFTGPAPINASIEEDQIDVVMHDADAERSELPSPPLTPANPASIASLQDHSEEARTSVKSADS